MTARDVSAYLAQTVIGARDEDVGAAVCKGHSVHVHGMSSHLLYGLQPSALVSDWVAVACTSGSGASDCLRSEACSWAACLQPAMPACGLRALTSATRHHRWHLCTTVISNKPRKRDTTIDVGCGDHRSNIRPCRVVRSPGPKYDVCSCFAHAWRLNRQTGTVLKMLPRRLGGPTCYSSMHPPLPLEEGRMQEPSAHLCPHPASSSSHVITGLAWQDAASSQMCTMFCSDLLGGHVAQAQRGVPSSCSHMVSVGRPGQAPDTKAAVPAGSVRCQQESA